MKVSKLFHWLYASVMFIPLLIAPIFGLAVRSDNNFSPIEVQAQDYEVVDFNQHLDINGTNITFTPIEYATNQGYYDICYFNYQQDSSHIYIFKGYFDNVSSNITQMALAYQTIGSTLNISSNSFYVQEISSENNPYNFLRVYTNDLNQAHINYYYFQLFDLTQMFGSGNEPTIEQFNTYFPNDYYEYTLSHKELLNVGTTTLSDADVGSQMVYTLYNATDKYFNFNQFLGIGNLFDWFLLNVFNGNAPLGFYIFWNLLIYWLLVSLAWLIFDIAMFVPKLAHRWLDKASLE